MTDDILDSPVSQDNEVGPVEDSWMGSVRYLMSNKNFKIFVVTNWIVGSLGVIWQVLNLYLRDLGIDYVALGFLYSIFTIVLLLGNLKAS